MATPESEYRVRMAPTPSRRTVAVLRYLLNSETNIHTAQEVAAALNMSPTTVGRQFTHFVNRGWLTRYDDGRVALTPQGRLGGADLVAGQGSCEMVREQVPASAKVAALVDDGLDATPLSRLDVEDPVLADRVRARLGWPVRHG
jgi:DNA-binding IclR family transcriptional regulator